MPIRGKDPIQRIDLAMREIAIEARVMKARADESTYYTSSGLALNDFINRTSAGITRLRALMNRIEMERKELTDALQTKKEKKERR